MRWGNTEPPINPPEVRITDCRECNGTGEIIDHEGPLGPLVARVQWCGECDGRGVRELCDSDIYVPDTWKEAEGIA